jgi:CheY-like chemotaxis protein
MSIIRSGAHIDLLFTDVVMPGPMSSVEMVRQAQVLKPGLKVLFTSGYTQNAIVHGGRLDLGVELLSKPYGRDELARKIRHVFGLPGVPNLGTLQPMAVAAVPPPPTADAASKSLRVLIVDDEPGSLEAVAEILVMLGHEPRKAANAQEALDALAGSRFDVLLADIRLPDMSGVELARRAVALSAEDEGALCIVFASGERVATDEPLPFAWRAIRKPFSVDELSEALRA